jgi:hypothetical protein
MTGGDGLAWLLVREFACLRARYEFDLEKTRESNTD